jgi:hypothetical protein
LSTAAGGSSFQIGIELMCGSNFTLGPLHLFLFSCLSVPDLAAIWLWDARSCTSIITQLLPTTDPTLNQQLSVSAQFGTLNALVRVNIKTSLPSTVGLVIGRVKIGMVLIPIGNRVMIRHEQVAPCHQKNPITFMS